MWDQIYNNTIKINQVSLASTRMCHKHQCRKQLRVYGTFISSVVVIVWALFTPEVGNL